MCDICFAERNKPRYVYGYAINIYSSLFCKPFIRAEYIQLIQGTGDSMYSSFIHNEFLRIVEQVSYDKCKINRYCSEL